MKKHIRNNNGSLTLEAAIALPIFIICFITLLSLLEMIKCYEDVENNLYKSSREIALYVAGTDVIEKFEDNIVSDAVLTVLSDTYVKNTMDKQMVEDGSSYQLISGGVNGINYYHSRVNLRETGVYKNICDDKDIVDIVANYDMEPLCNLFNVRPYHMINRCRLRAWTGFDTSDSTTSDNSERIVYITETGTVYHLSRSCSHINLSITPINYSDLESSRNVNGGKYKLCEICGDLLSNKAGLIYITSEGDRYHSSLHCSGLKRTVNAIPISQVGDRKACSRCSYTN